MNWVDGVIIVVAIIFAIIGYLRGLVRTALNIVGLIIGVVLAGQFSDELGNWLSPGGAAWAQPLAFAIIIIATLLVADILGMMLRRLFKLIMLGWVDRVGGFILGAAIGAFLCVAIFLSMGHAGYEIEWIKKAISGSFLAELLIDKFRLLLGLLPEEFDIITKFFE